MNRGLSTSTEASRSEASATGTRNVTPFIPARAAQMFDRTAASAMGQQADQWALADGWNFRLLV